MENSSVMLMFRPSAIIASIAGTPSGVPGIFTIRFGRLMRSTHWRTSRIVPSVSCARSGETSTETNPSVPPVWSKTGRSTSHAAVMSSATRVSYASATPDRRARRRANDSS